MGVYGGPAVVIVEGSDAPVPVTAWLVSRADFSGELRWRGRLEPLEPGALLAAHLAARAQLVIGDVTSDIQITVYAPSGPCEFEGLGPPPL